MSSYLPFPLIKDSVVISLILVLVMRRYCRPTRVGGIIKFRITLHVSGNSSVLASDTEQAPGVLT